VSVTSSTPVALPERLSLSGLRAAAATCRGCALYRHATQTVFGEGPLRPKLMLVGEQPGDAEDREGHPFAGPAGKLLKRALGEAGIGPRDVYLTNAVKHFKFVERGKRRIHATPKTIEIRACAPWLEAELTVVKPGLVVALGATAAHALFGNGFQLTKRRGEVFATDRLPRAAATIHPSAILRQRSDDERHAEMERFVADFTAFAKVAAREAR
jgi:uracil-DNA glycosylase